MVNRATKHCDACGRKVAEKGLVFFRTEYAYVTVRMDSPPTYANHEDNTTRDNFHYCLPCWMGIAREARKAVKK